MAEETPRLLLHFTYFVIMRSLTKIGLDNKQGKVDLWRWTISYMCESIMSAVCIIHPFTQIIYSKTPTNHQ